jgi:hypothetical protein
VESLTLTMVAHKPNIEIEQVLFLTLSLL